MVSLPGRPLRLRLVPRSASLKFSVLGLHLTLVVPSLHDMSAEAILDLILEALMPDLDLEALIEAILRGNVQINPFGSFGSR